MKTFKDYLKEDETKPAVNNLLKIGSLIERIRIQSKVSHWNVKGKNFLELHAFFDDVYEKAIEMVDKVIERALAVNPSALVNLNPQYDAIATQSADANVRILTDLIVSKEILDLANDLDEVTLNLIQEIVTDLDKTKWMLDSIELK